MAELPKWDKLVNQTEHQRSTITSLPEIKAIDSVDSVHVYCRNSREIIENDNHKVHIIYEIELKIPLQQIMWLYSNQLFVISRFEK